MKRPYIPEGCDQQGRIDTGRHAEPSEHDAVGGIILVVAGLLSAVAVIGMLTAIWQAWRAWS